MGIEEELHEIAETNEQIIRNLTREQLMYHHLEIERELRKMDFNFESKWGGERKYLPQDFTFEDYLLTLLNFKGYGIFSLSHFMELPKEELVEKLGHDFKGE